MILHPRPNQPVRLHYAARWRGLCPHGAVGVVEVVGRGPGPRNVAVRLGDGRVVNVSRGNLVRSEA